MDFIYKQYADYINVGDKSKQKAELAYENNNFKEAVKHYYHASLAYEMAKEIAIENIYDDITYRISAFDKEYYCLEKLDELKLFRKVDTIEIIK